MKAAAEICQLLRFGADATACHACLQSGTTGGNYNAFGYNQRDNYICGQIQRQQSHPQRGRL